VPLERRFIVLARPAAEPPIPLGEQGKRRSKERGGATPSKLFCRLWPAASPAELVRV
jgi:hypothetical protein